jgi:pimeloyl-ACP methyl ester carboxylesterase
LIHGGVGAIEMWEPVLTALSQNRRVIAVDLQAHGRTADIDRPLSFELMADDIAALIKYVKLDKADVMGYSLGGCVALQAAIRHPEVVNKLVIVSAPFKSDGWYPEIRSQMRQTGATGAEGMRQSPLHHLYEQLAPRPQDWPVLFTKLGRLLSKDYDWTNDIKQMKITTMIVVGDADAIHTSSAVEFFQLLGGALRDAGWDGAGRPKSELAVLPNTTHYTISNSSALATTVIPFLDKKD